MALNVIIALQIKRKTYCAIIKRGKDPSKKNLMEEWLYNLHNPEVNDPTDIIYQNFGRDWKMKQNSVNPIANGCNLCVFIFFFIQTFIKINSRYILKSVKCGRSAAFTVFFLTLNIIQLFNEHISTLFFPFIAGVNRNSFHFLL